MISATLGGAVGLISLFVGYGLLTSLALYCGVGSAASVIFAIVTTLKLGRGHSEEIPGKLCDLVASRGELSAFENEVLDEFKKVGRTASSSGAHELDGKLSQLSQIVDATEAETQSEGGSQRGWQHAQERDVLFVGAVEAGSNGLFRMVKAASPYSHPNLMTEKFRAKFCSDPVDAIELLKSSPASFGFVFFDVDLCDDQIGLTELIDALMELRQNCPEIVVILFSNEFSANDYGLSRITIADASLRTPASRAELARCIHNARDNSRVWQQRVNSDRRNAFALGA